MTNLLRSTAGIAVLFIALQPITAHAQLIWDGPEVTFTKADNADPSAAANQDSITDGVLLTRGNAGVLYNAASENSASNSSPIGTQWAQGTTEDLANLSFTTLKAASGNQMKNVPGKNFVLFLVEDSIYIDLTFNSWTQGQNGGGFSYTRTTESQVETSTEGVGSSIPGGFTLEQNYPNPFNPLTSIRFSVSQASEVALKVYNILGAEVSVLVNETMAVGVYEVAFEASSLPSGSYFYRLEAVQADGAVAQQTRQMTLLK
ncbi:MAG: T9SS C-terminal target domain-containing protein [Rhodothermaeota bacterium MED-G64]|nr:MAG: T9SS C-terminal target domain-containing protein [Rhodothermaeota bacterium MED-G64]